jgi:hypothetical protein
MNIEDIKHHGIYTVAGKEGGSLHSKIQIGSRVEVVEIRECDLPLVYCYGVNGGSAYIHHDNLV